MALLQIYFSLRKQVSEGCKTAIEADD